MPDTLQRIRLTNWWPEVALLAGFVALTVALVRGQLLTLDIAVADWATAHRPAWLYWVLRVLNYLGQGGQVLTPVALVLTGLFFWRTRSWLALLPFAAGFVSTYVTIGPLKIWLDRAAPAFQGPDREILFNPAASGKYAMSYPSGHVANAIIWYFVLALLVAMLLRRPLSTSEQVLLRAVPPAIVFVTTTWTAFHWITDSVAGLLLGLLVVRVLSRVPWPAPTDRRASPA